MNPVHRRPMLSFWRFPRQEASQDCLRHYEILLAGCIPYFLDIDPWPFWNIVGFVHICFKLSNAASETWFPSDPWTLGFFSRPAAWWISLGIWSRRRRKYIDMALLSWNILECNFCQSPAFLWLNITIWCSRSTWKKMTIRYSTGFLPYNT